MSKKDTGKFEVFKGKDNQFYFRLKAPSGEVIGRSEGFTQKYNASKGIEAVKVLSQSDDNFHVYKDQNEQWRFYLKAQNGEIILHSAEGYNTKYNAENAYRAIKNKAHIADLARPVTSVVHDSLYPEILFHFTGRSGLYGLLESKFKVSYAKEKIIGIRNERTIGVPMVSFCDLRLSELKTHMKKYGSYGIGLTKDWANRKGLNPVLYLSQYSPFTDGLISGLDSIYKKMRQEDSSSDYMSIYNTYRFVKNYEAPLKRAGHPIVINYRYADEREWRFVPSLDNLKLKPFVPKYKIESPKNKEKLNRSIDIRLSFKPEDIRYLIVEKDDEIPQLIDHLRDMFGYDEASKLTSRILTAEQIEKDI